MITTPEQMREAAAKCCDMNNISPNFSAPAQSINTAMAIAAAIRAIPIAPQPVAVTVKPLVWDDRGYEWSWWSDTVFGRGTYQIRCEGGIGYLVDFDGVTIGDPHDTLEIAKAAAQADYEARILSALTIHPADPLSDPRVVALVDAARGLLFAHDHGNGLEGWYNVREKLRAALRAIGGEV